MTTLQPFWFAAAAAFAGTARARGRLLVWLAAFAGAGLEAASFQDLYLNRETATDETGQVIGDNLAATRETGEPRHGDRTGGASVWISWVAPTNGIVTFNTAGSTFDTLLSAYYQDDGGSGFDDLEEAAENDDEDGGGASEIVFGAIAGERYEIAVDGYRGTSGTILLSWSLQVAPDPPPIIINTPDDQAVQEGQPVTLSVALSNPSAYRLHWYLNDEELEEQEAATLFISALARTNLGQYRLRLSLDEYRFFTKPVELQINSEGLGDSLVRDKVFDAVDRVLGTAAGPAPLSPPPKYRKSGGQRALDSVNRGYNGSQLFNTIKATAAPGEPAICGHSGAVIWFAYEPPAAGTLMLNTAGSDVGVALAVFAFTGALTNLAQLQAVTCDAPPANGSVSEIDCAVLAGRTYVVGIVGTGDGRGVIQLNYQLDESRPPAAPQVNFGGAELAVAVGAPLALAAAATGSPPLHFTWLKDGGLVPEGGTGSLNIPAASQADQGAYRVRVSNHIAETLSGALNVRVLPPPELRVQLAAGRLLLSFDSLVNLFYELEYRLPAGDDIWRPAAPAVAGTGAAVTVTNQLPSPTDAWFRLRVR